MRPLKYFLYLAFILNFMTVGQLAANTCQISDNETQQCILHDGPKILCTNKKQLGEEYAYSYWCPFAKLADLVKDWNDDFSNEAAGYITSTISPNFEMLCEKWDKCGMDHNVPGFACHNESFNHAKYANSWLVDDFEGDYQLDKTTGFYECDKYFNFPSMDCCASNIVFGGGGGGGPDWHNESASYDPRSAENIINTYALHIYHPELVGHPCFVTNQGKFKEVLDWTTGKITEFPSKMPFFNRMGDDKKHVYKHDFTWAYEHFCYQSMTEKSSDGDYSNHYEINAICDPLKTGCNTDCINTRPGCENMPANAPKDVCPDHCEVTKNLNLKYCPAECKSTEHVFYQTDDGKSQKQTCDPSKCDIKCNNQIPGCEGLDPEATGSNCLPQKCKVTTSSIVGETCPQGDQGWDNCVKVEEQQPVQTTAVGCPSVDGNTCEITKEIDVGFDWSPGAMVELKCRYKSPTWPFELDLEGIAEPGCNPDTSKCGKPVTPTFDGGYLFNIGGPEIGVTPKKPGSIRIAGFDFSSLKDKNIKLCLKHPDCYVDYYDNDFGDAEDVGCDEGSVSTSSSLGNGMEQQSFALTASPVCNIGAALGNKFSADVSKKQLFKAGDDCARNIVPHVDVKELAGGGEEEMAAENNNNAGLILASSSAPKGFKLTDNGGFGGNATPIISAVDIHVNGQYAGSFCSANASRILLNGIKQQYQMNKEDGIAQYCYPHVSVSQSGKDITLVIEEDLLKSTAGLAFYHKIFPKTNSLAKIWADWIHVEENKLFTTHHSDCLKEAEQYKSMGIKYFFEQAKCYDWFIKDFNQFMYACADENPASSQECKVSVPAGTYLANKNYRMILQSKDLKPVSEVTFSHEEMVYDDTNDEYPNNWSGIVANEKENLASMALGHLAQKAEMSCKKYICCQWNKEERAKCIEACGEINGCKAYPTDFLAIMGGGTNAKIYKEICADKVNAYPVELLSNYNLDKIMNNKWYGGKMMMNSLMCAIVDGLGSKTKLLYKFKPRPNLNDIVDPNDFIEIPKGGPSPIPGPGPGPLVTDPSPIDIMKQYMNPGNHGNGSKQMFDNGKKGNPFGTKP